MLNKVYRYIKRISLSIYPAKYRMQEIVNRYIMRKLIDKRIVSGPFKGQSCSFGSLPRILGTQEIELHPIIDEVVDKKFKTIINIGSHDGYYCIGFASLLPESKIIAFEADKHFKEILMLSAKKNNVENRIEVNGVCGINDLRNVIRDNGSCCVLIDVDGGEFFLMDPSLIPELLHTYIVLEYHEHVVEGMAEILKSRFEASHEVIEIYQRPRTFEDFPLVLSSYLVFLLKSYLVQTMNEFRLPGNHWLILKPKKVI